MDSYTKPVDSLEFKSTLEALNEAYPHFKLKMKIFIEKNSEWMNSLEMQVIDSLVQDNALLDFCTQVGLLDEVPYEKITQKLMEIDSGERQLITQLASEFKIEQQEWISKPALARGVLVTVAGEPKGGKSLICLDIIARASRGKPLFGKYSDIPEPMTSVYWSSEDSITRQLVPRLMNAGADLNKIHLLKKGMSPSLPSEIEEVARILEDTRPTLFVLDTINSFLGADIDTSNDSKVRWGIGELVNLADMYQTTFLLINHLNKDKKKKMSDRVMGSKAFTGLPRQTLLVAKDPDSESETILSVHLNNYAKENPNYRYEITGGPNEEYPYVKFLGETDKTVEDVETDDTSTNTVEDCSEYLLNLILSMPKKEIGQGYKGFCQSEGYNDSAIRRARESLKKQGLIRIEQNREGPSGRETYLVSTEQVEQLEQVALVDPFEERG